MTDTVIIGLSNLKEFDHSVSDFKVFFARLQQFFIVNNIESVDKKRAFLLNSLTEETYKLLLNLCVPQTPECKSFEELVTILEKHLTPVRSYFAARLEFYTARKKTCETIAEWSARVRSLASKCGFADELEKVLRDIFVIGMGTGKILDRLMEEDASMVSFQKIQEIAQARESALRERTSVGGHSLNQASTYADIKSEPVETHHVKKVQGRKFTGDKCKVCGKNNHISNQCYFKNNSCNMCGLKGHISTVCRNKNKSKKFIKKNNYNLAYNEVEPESMFTLRNVNTDTESIKIPLQVENQLVNFEIDTGSQYSAISMQFYNKFLSKYEISNVNIILKDYAGFMFKPAGKIKIRVYYKDKPYNLDMLIINNGGPPLLGREGLTMLNLGIKELNFVSSSEQKVLNLVNKYQEVFKNEIGTYTKGKIALKCKPNTSPSFFKARPLAFALKSMVEKEIDRLVARNILIPVENSEWATPIVPILKPNKTIRLCGDFKCTLNPVLEDVHYPLPRIEYIFEKLKDGIKFSKLDLSEAYQQVLLTEESSKLVTISTHKGLFRYTRLPYGIKSAPSLFQKIMEQILIDMPGVACFLDDIIVTAPDDFTHFDRLEKVFKKLCECGLRVKREKCEFFRESVKYLGHIINKNGLNTTQERVTAIKNAKIPSNVTEVKSFVGMVNFYHKFIPDAATLLHPLYKLLRKNENFKWNEDCQKSFVKVKNILTSSQVLAHFNPKLPIVLTVDASSYGIGAVISHVIHGGTRPIAYTSRVLSKCETNYSQIEREALAIKFGIEKFYQYLYGQKFILETDHKPLVAIFGPKKGIPAIAASRLQRWASFLSCFDFDIRYVKTDKNKADWLSRASTNRTDVTALDISGSSYLNFQSEANKNLLVDNKILVYECKKDKILNKVFYYTKHGWPNYKLSNELQPYFNKKNEISIENNSLLWGYRIIVPEKCRSLILNELHSNHIGIVKMKALARSYFWWPDIDKNIENLIKNCEACNHFRPSPEKAELIPWNWPTKPWSRIHLDFFTIYNKNFLVMIDAMSKWIECFEMSNIGTELTLMKLRETFARFGIPETIVSDNARTFTSDEFQLFCSRNGIKHKTGAPFFPATNGLAENAVKIIKNCIKKSKFKDSNNENINNIINRFLLQYRNIPHTTTGECPAKLLQNRSLRCRFDILLPDTNKVVTENQAKQQFHFKGKRNLKFELNEQVLVRDFRKPKPSWIPASITKVLGYRTFQVRTIDGDIWKRHLNQILKRNNQSKNNPNDNFIPRSSLNQNSENSQTVSCLDNSIKDNESRDRYDLRRRSHLKPPERLVV